MKRKRWSQLWHQLRDRGGNWQPNFLLSHHLLLVFALLSTFCSSSSLGRVSGCTFANHRNVVVVHLYFQRFPRVSSIAVYYKDKGTSRATQQLNCKPQSPVTLSLTLMS